MTEDEHAQGLQYLREQLAEAEVALEVERAHVARFHALAAEVQALKLLLARMSRPAHAPEG